MNLGYILSGSAPVIKRMKLGASMTTAGIPVLVAAAGSAGVDVATVTTAPDAAGVTLDTGTYSTTQGDAEGLISVVINPDAVWRILMSANATAGAQLTVTTNDVAETAGTVIDKTGASGAGDPDINSPSMDEGMAFCVSGANAGQSRKIVTVGATTGTVLVPFTNDIASGDEFIIVPWTPQDIAGDNIHLTSNLAAARQNIAVGTGADFMVIDLDWAFPDRDAARRSSYVHGLLADHVLNK